MRKNLGCYPMTRRELLGAGVGLLGGMIATAGTPTAALAATVAQVPTVSAGARQGGTLRFGNIGDFSSLEPQTFGGGGLDQFYQVWDQLISVDSQQQVQPMLAENWDFPDNYQQIKFNLRHGVQFHTGRELTADDVKFSLLRIQDPKIGSPLTGRMAPLMVSTHQTSIR